MCSSWLCVNPCTARFPVGAHARVRLHPCRGVQEAANWCAALTSMFLFSLSLSKKNKYIYMEDGFRDRNLSHCPLAGHFYLYWVDSVPVKKYSLDSLSSYCLLFLHVSSAFSWVLYKSYYITSSSKIEYFSILTYYLLNTLLFL